jgi:hypothetical protein
MNKPKITFLVDVLLFLSLVTMAGLGLLLQFVLTPAAGAGGQATLTWLGLARHHWEMVYFSGLLFVLALAAAHLIFHWSRYVKLSEEAVPNATARNILAPLGAVAALLLFCLPLLAKPDLKDVGAVADPPATPPPAQVSQAETAVPPAVQPSPQDSQAKTAALSKARPQKISPTRRPGSHGAKYRHPAPQGKWAKRKPPYCPRGRYPAYVLAARRH